MSQSDRNSPKENKSRGNEPNFNWRGVILIVVAFSFIALAMLFYRGGMQPVEDVPYNRFLELLDNKQIVTDKNYPLQLVVEDGRPTQTLRGAYIRQGVGSAPAQQVPFRTTVYLSCTNNSQPPAFSRPLRLNLTSWPKPWSVFSRSLFSSSCFTSFSVSKSGWPG